MGRKQELGGGYLKKERNWYDGEGTEILVRRALERCVDVDEDYAKLFIKGAGAVSDGDNPSSTDAEDEADPQYRTFLANVKRDGTSYALKVHDQNELLVFVKYDEEDESDDEGRYDYRRNMELELNGVEKDHDNVREKYRLGSASIVEKQKMKDGVLSKNRRKKDRGLDKRKHRNDVKIVSGKEKKTQNDCKFMDARVKIESEADSDSLESQSEVEILQNVGEEVGWGSSSNPFVPSVGHCQNLDATIIDSGFRKEVLNLLMRPYNDEEYNKLWKDIKMQLPSSSTNRRVKSLLSHHKAVNREIKRANHDKDKKLNIMRGFFFWLEHLTRQDAFQPWEDAECLQTMPGSS